MKTVPPPPSPWEKKMAPCFPVGVQFPFVPQVQPRYSSWPLLACFLPQLYLTPLHTPVSELASMCGCALQSLLKSSLGFSDSCFLYIPGTATTPRFQPVFSTFALTPWKGVFQGLLGRSILESAVSFHPSQELHIPKMSMSIIFDGSDLQDLFNNTDYNTIIPSSETAPCKEPWHLNKYVVVTVYSLVFFLSLVGNLLVVLVISYNRIKRTSTDVYLLHLAIADLLFAITLPFWAVYKADEWVFKTFMCKAVSVLQEVNFYSGILLLACISIDRYLAIVHATEAVAQKRHLVKFICLGIWLVSVFLSLPILIFRTDFKTPKNGVACSEDLGSEGTEKWRIILRISRHIFGFFLPLLIMIFCYGFTIRTLCQTKSNQKIRAMKVIFAVVVAFLFCWMPYNITVFIDSLMRSRIIEETCERRTQVETALSVTEVFGYMHNCINPILYAFIGQKFRNSFLKILASRGMISKTFMSKYGRSSSYSSTSGNTSTTL